MAGSVVAQFSALVLVAAALTPGLLAEAASCPAPELLEDEVSLLQHKADLPGDAIADRGAAVPLFSALSQKLNRANRTQAELKSITGRRASLLQVGESSLAGIQLALPDDHEALRRDAMEAARVACENRERLVFIGILSAPQNLYRRNVARTVFLSSFREAGFDKCLQMKFVIGHEEFSTSHQGQIATPDQMDREQELEEEQAKYGDVLRIPVPESYKSLPDKVLALLSHSLSENYDFVAKVDDDMLPDLTTMLPLITGMDPESFLYSGRYLWSSPRYNSQMGANGEFAPYFGGPTYLLSRGLAHQITVEDAQRTFQFLSYGSKSEDIDMGKWVKMASEFSGKSVRFEQAHLSYTLCGPSGCQRAGYDNMAHE